MTLVVVGSLLFIVVIIKDNSTYPNVINNLSHSVTNCDSGSRNGGGWTIMRDILVVKFTGTVLSYQS